MELKPRSVSARYINSKKDYAILKLNDSFTLVYGEPSKKTSHGVAFKDADMMMEVATNLMSVAMLEQKREK